MGQPSKSFIFFPGPAPSLAETRELLASRNRRLSFEEDGDSLGVRWDDGPVLRVSRVTGKTAPADAQRAARAEGCLRSVLSCAGWFEIDFDDLDEVLADINTLIQIWSTLQDETMGVIYSAWNGTMQVPAE